jgi:hypothetical protein
MMMFKKEIQFKIKGKVKAKFLPRTGHAGPEGE